MKFNLEISKRIVTLLESSGISDQDWSTRLGITPARLANLRSGIASLTSKESKAILDRLGDNSPLTLETKRRHRGLSSVARAARKTTKPARGGLHRSLT
ncbi:MAG TPA: hypothetical protein VH370_11105 [Humisphaera sp.]|jgi:hypothetical protein|nr:hypothetical protein [Humisphaera sp.]